MKRKPNKSKLKGSTLTSARLLKNRPPDPEPEQITPPELMAKAEDAVKPAAVQNGRIHATYLGLGLERDGAKKLVHLDFAFALEDAHNGLLPEKVREAWRWLVLSGNKMVEVLKLSPVTLDVYMNPTLENPIFHLANARFSKAIVGIIEEVGKGKTIEVVRFKFRLLVDRTPEVIQFAAWCDTEEFWLTMPETQQTLAAGA